MATEPDPRSEAFLGRTFIFVDMGNLPPEIVQAFDRIEPKRVYHYEESGQSIAYWDVAICRGFRGFAKAPNRQY